ncbi:coiled-coil domain-containing protein 169-like [Argopecten irradians]|uniref:coiled-coil domain-containing protein 169-like n=1 Tax=Argopecten irradians TaxID=31199 RepID=UPI003714B3C1
MAVEVVGDFELEKIRAEIQQEKHMKEMLEQSTAELQYTIDELEKRYDGVVDEGNEWKTRCETQQEMNNQLDKQIEMLQSKVQEAKSNLKDDHTTRYRRSRIFRDVGRTLGMLPKGLRQLDFQYTYMIENYEFLSSEKVYYLKVKHFIILFLIKAYHKAHEERKTYSTEIHAAATAAARNRLPVSHRELEPIPGSRTPRDMGRFRCSHIDNWSKQNKNHPPPNSRGPRYMDPTWTSFTRNIPEDQRIIDPKRGPIRKTAAVKSLPSLEMT